MPFTSEIFFCDKRYSTFKGNVSTEDHVKIKEVVSWSSLRQDASFLKTRSFKKFAFSYGGSKLWLQSIFFKWAELTHLLHNLHVGKSFLCKTALTKTRMGHNETGKSGELSLNFVQIRPNQRFRNDF